MVQTAAVTGFGLFADGVAFEVKSKIGEGAYATVYHCFKYDDIDEGEDVCMKASPCGNTECVIQEDLMIRR